MKLVGSTTSPYARRIRLLLAGTPHDFVNLDIYGGDRDELRRQTPALKIPMLEDNGQVLYDSRVIARYLSPKLGLPPLNWDQENQLTLVDAANDSFVTLLLSKRSGIDIDQDSLFYTLQHERVTRTLNALAEQVEAGDFDHWNYPAICLYCLVDWIDFRDLLEGKAAPVLLAYRDRCRDRPGVVETDPRVS
ncbi:glutathione S-transferase family protein [Marinobacter zhejiangensis]|uniref:Glutathione S-transferase n=1 Tax=Marinobacter zhejiangensis TaxID=488535 RepID=A0A1I4L616_9GAMM|nr:glutathione S-transferase family protein [Marinobacter zhejiangensis]SFL86488.1 glutathione S-transferase [Marinobacter zhejiangensis]